MADLEAGAELNQDSSQPRGSFDSRRKHTKHRFGCEAISRGRIKISYFLLLVYEKGFAKLGCFLARRPLVPILVFLCIALVSGIGFIFLDVEQPSYESFIVTDSQSRQGLNRAAQFFPLLDARQEQIIMVPKYGENIITEDCLKDAILVHQAVMNISGYKELCFRHLHPRNKQDCVFNSPLELFGDYFDNLTNISSFLVHEWANPTRILSTGQTFHSSFNEMFSNFYIEHETAQADALRLTYFIRKSTSEEEDQKVRHFEGSFESLVSSTSHHLNCTSVYFSTGKTTNDALQSILRPRERPLYLSALIMTLAVFTVIYFSSNTLSCLGVVMLILLSILLPLIFAAGVISMTSTSLFPTTLFVPFLLLGKATSDIALLLVQWEKQKNVPSLEQRVSICVTRAGFLVVLSAVCGTVLFGIAIKSSFNVISNFFLVALPAFAAVLVAAFFVTVALLIYFERHLKAFTRWPLCNIGWLRKRPLRNPKVKLKHCLESFTRLMLSRGGTLLSLTLLVCIVILCLLSAIQSHERMGASEAFYQNDNFKQFSEVQQKFLSNGTDVSVVFPEEVDYSRDTIQNQIINICLRMQEASYSHGESICWMTALREWSRYKNINCSNSEFYRCLELFLNQSSNVLYQRDLHFKDLNPRLNIIASRVHLKMTFLNQFQEDRALLEKLRKDVLKQTSLEAVPASEKFFHLDDLYFLEKETVLALVIATIIVFALSLLSSLSFGVATYLAITFDILVFEAASIMERWDIRLNHISFLPLSVVIILSLNFSIQMAHSYTFSAKTKARDRMIEALSSLGWPVLVAALMTMSGSVSLGFIFRSLSKLFSQFIPLVVGLGLLHALVIFPPTLLLLVEILGHLESRSDVDVLFSGEEKKAEDVLLHLENGGIDIEQLKVKHPGIAIVGISCRFPGASSKDQFWDFLEQGKCSIGAFPHNRVEEHEKFLQQYHPKRFVSGRLCAVNGSYLEEIKAFDNTFFGISSQEAHAMDPQQRILLQVVYEAIEDAGMRLEDLQKCKTGVFVGVMNLDYGALLVDKTNYHNINQFSGTGCMMSILANRVSFCLNLTGPSLAVDTACSSSLTALKIACDNLFNEDCDIAIVCAPNVVLNDATQMASSMAGLLAPDGRCKSFDASGDGYGRGEGFAAVILKLSKAALSDKDDV